MKAWLIRVSPFFVSVWLHLATFLILTALTLVPEGGSEGPGGDFKKQGGSDKQENIIERSVEIEVFTLPDEKGDLKAEKPQKKSEGVKECEGNNWFGGIGVRMAGFSHGGEEIGEVFAGYPAEKVGLQKGDVVRFVDGQPYNFGEIRGEPGTSLILTIYRPSTDQVMDLFIVRDKICTQEKI
jgi:C-terminal processing protease CtpA/Prc